MANFYELGKIEPYFQDDSDVLARRKANPRNGKAATTIVAAAC